LDELSLELTIKPGKLFSIKRPLTSKKFEKNIFVKPGEIIVEDILADKLCFREYLQIKNN
jgi:hypothetical protein